MTTTSQILSILAGHGSEGKFDLNFHDVLYERARTKETLELFARSNGIPEQAEEAGPGFPTANLKLTKLRDSNVPGEMLNLVLFDSFRRDERI